MTMGWGTAWITMGSTHEYLAGVGGTVASAVMGQVNACGTGWEVGKGYGGRLCAYICAFVRVKDERSSACARANGTRGMERPTAKNALRVTRHGTGVYTNAARLHTVQGAS